MTVGRMTQLGLFEGVERIIPNRVIKTAKVGTNADLFPSILQLYAKPGDKIADVTYGKGVFWKKVDTSLYQCFFSDLMECPASPALGGIDMTNLPYGNETIDMVVIDPPYRPITGSRITGVLEPTMSGRYGLSTSLRNQGQVLALYKAGMAEAERVLKSGGILVIKCQDAVESRKQHWMHIDIFNIAVGLGFFGEDLFVLVNSSAVVDSRKQQHGRKNHSFFWVFRKK